MENVKIFLFVDDMMIYIENLWNQQKVAGTNKQIQPCCRLQG